MTKVTRLKLKVKNYDTSRGAGYQNFSPFTFHFSLARERGGFTVVETLVATALLLLLAIFIMSGIAAFRESSALDQAVDEAVELLRLARSRTLASESAASYGVHFETSSVILFRGSYVLGDPENAVVPLPRGVEISNISLSTTTANVAFERLSAASQAIGTVTFRTLRSSRTKQVQILSSGAFLKL